MFMGAEGNPQGYSNRAALRKVCVFAWKRITHCFRVNLFALKMSKRDERLIWQRRTQR
jgi:hypothetical protein